MITGAVKSSSQNSSLYNESQIFKIQLTDFRATTALVLPSYQSADYQEGKISNDQSCYEEVIHISSSFLRMSNGQTDAQCNTI